MKLFLFAIVVVSAGTCSLGQANLRGESHGVDNLWEPSNKVTTVHNKNTKQGDERRILPGRNRLDECPNLDILMSSEPDKCPAKWTHRLIQSGQTLESSVQEKHIGMVVSISSGGNRLAVMYQRTNEQGLVKVYKATRKNSWRQVGNNIPLIGKIQPEWWSFSNTLISMSANGKVVAVGSPYSNEGGENTGHVDVYEESSGRWKKGETQSLHRLQGLRGLFLYLPMEMLLPLVQMTMAMTRKEGTFRCIATGINVGKKMGGDIENGKDRDTFGRVVSLSGNGKRVAVVFSKGVRVLAFDRTKGKWEPIGQDIVTCHDSKVSISHDGNIVAVPTSVFRYSEDEKKWLQLGGLLGVNKRCRSGTQAVSLSGCGTRVAVGDALRKTNGGRVEVYDFDGKNWCKISKTMFGDRSFVNMGYSVHLSQEGNHLAVGAPYVQFYYDKSYVQVFSIIKKN